MVKVGGQLWMQIGMFDIVVVEQIVKLWIIVGDVFCVGFEFKVVLVCEFDGWDGEIYWIEFCYGGEDL